MQEKLKELESKLSEEESAVKKLEAGGARDKEEKKRLSEVRLVLRDKMNCTAGFASCFLRVPLACLGSMAQGSRAGTLAVYKPHYVSFCLLVYCSTQRTNFPWESSGGTVSHNGKCIYGDRYYT